MLQPTNRVYSDKETGERFRLYHNSDTHEHKLISDGSKKYAQGTEVNGFYLCAFDAVQIKVCDYKNDVKIYSLGMGEFYSVKDGEQVTHRKFVGFKRFTKL